MSKEKRKKMAIIASKGTLDMAYPPLLLASTAAAMVHASRLADIEKKKGCNSFLFTTYDMAFYSVYTWPTRLFHC